MSDINKLKDALLTIRGECTYHKSSCSGCPFLIDSFTCGITGIEMIGQYDYRKQPKYWKIPDIRLMEKVECK